MNKLKSRSTIVAAVVAVILLLGIVVGYLQNLRPDPPPLKGDAQSPPGTATVNMLVDLMEAQLNSFGGWLPNDLPVQPGYFLDNAPQFQLGVLQVVRHGSRVLRDNLTRLRTSDAVNQQVDLAYSAYANDPRKWAFPSAESAFRRGNTTLRRFLRQLRQGESEFYPRADNLVQLLEPLVSELGGVTTNLLQGQQGGEVPWLQIDDNFYYAMGAGYAAGGLMKAVRRDFIDVLRDKNGLELLDAIIKSLDESQFEPIIVTNGSKDGILANHSNNLKVYLEDARQKMNSLITILRQG